MSVLRAAALTMLLFPVDVLYVIGVFHYGDCGGTGKTPPPHKMWGNLSKKEIDEFKWKYAYAEGRIACPYGEKIRGRVTLWNDNQPQGGKVLAQPAACGPE